MTAIEPRKQPTETTPTPTAIPDEATWKYSTTTTKADPGPGNVRMNNTDWSKATEIYVSATDVAGAAQGTAIAAGVLLGARLAFREGGTTRGTFEATDNAALQGTTWFVIPVKYVDGAAPANGRVLTVTDVQRTWWTLSEAGDTAEWNVSAHDAAEMWVGGDFAQAAVRVEMRRMGFGWTPVRIESNRSPQVVYSGQVVLPGGGTIVVGTTNILIGAHRVRMVLESIESGTLHCDIAFPHPVA